MGLDSKAAVFVDGGRCSSRVEEVPGHHQAELCVGVLPRAHLLRYLLGLEQDAALQAAASHPRRRAARPVLKPRCLALCGRRSTTCLSFLYSYRFLDTSLAESIN